jgi:hypothetical protein
MVTIAFLSENEGSYLINLSDMIGRIVKTEIDFADVGENSHIMNLDGIAKGIYIVELRKGNISKKVKLLIE